MRLNLEPLESRDMPASLLAIGNLFIYFGDMQPHNVVIGDDGHGNVAGVLDAGAPVTASGIDTIEALSLFGAKDNIGIIAAGRISQQESWLAEVSGHSSVTMDDTVGSDSRFFTMTVFRLLNDGATKIMAGPTGDESGSVANVISLFSTGSVDINRMGDVGGYANDTITNLNSSVRSMLEFTGASLDPNGGVTESYFGITSPGSSIAMNLNVSPGSLGNVDAVEYGAVSGGDSLTLNLIDSNKSDMGILTHGPGAMVSATPNVQVRTY